MTKIAVVSLVLLAVVLGQALGCLITNCPRGGKRGGKFGFAESAVKPCVTCGPGHSGQCFGPNICCGPFGCLMGTPETLRCHRDGFFHDREPCTAGSAPCRKNTGRCAFDGICCDQDSCHADKGCALDDKAPIDLYNLITYQAELNGEK